MGVDPSAGPDETGITFEDALEAHINDKEVRERTAEGYRYHLKKHLAKFRKRSVADITRQDCRELLETLTRRSGRTTASSTLRTVRAVINTARRIDETIGENPTDALRIPVPPARQVDPLDIADWWSRTERLSPLLRDLQRATLLTGARRLSIAQVKREHVDLDKRVLRFTHMKTGGELLFPMGPYLTDMLRSRMQDDEMIGSAWLWPSRSSRAGHIVEPKRKGMPGPHALRHHCRTLMIAAGVPYAEGALLLGQKLPGASGGYVHGAHLVEALRSHAEALESHILVRAKSS